nr:MAG TPA: hypothetical protein [Bacteriophage sp.]
MSEIVKVLERQLEKEKAAAVEKLTISNLDAIAKITTILCNMKCLERDTWESAPVAEAAESIIKKYSNGRYDHNIDALYDAYIAAKQAYKQNGDQGHKDKLMEAVGRLMVEIYDMLSSMVVDSDFLDERKEIQRQIRKLADM